MSLYLVQQDCKRAVATLTSLTNDELDKIMNDDEQIENIILGTDQAYLREIQDEKDKVQQSNSELAEENLLREPELVEGREKLQTLSQQAEDLHKRVEEKAKELRTKGGNTSIETSLALLQTAASEMEDESDQCAKQFLANDIELDDFLEQFLLKRKVMHLRLVKAEKLAKIIARGGPIDPSIPNYMNAPPVNINTNYFPGVPISTGPAASVPYPTGPIGMPMPGMNFFQNHY